MIISIYGFPVSATRDVARLAAQVVTGVGFLGAGAIILPSVHIGKNVIVGAGSVVTKSIPAGEIWIGNPAKFLRKI